MNNKDNHYIACGDLHGDVERFDKVITYAKNNNLIPIFIGDYVDSFTFTKNQQNELLSRMVSEYVLANGDVKKPIYLIGNHDLQYLYHKKSAMNRSTMCSGYSNSKHSLFTKNFDILKNMGALKTYHSDYENNVLFTHAGLSKPSFFNISPYIPTQGDEIDLHTVSEVLGSIDIFSFTSTHIDDPDPMVQRKKGIFDVGYSSGGKKETVGGIFWNRWEDLNGVSPDDAYFNSFVQVHGHTTLSDKISSHEKFFCINIDVFKRDNGTFEYLLISDGNFEIVEF